MIKKGGNGNGSLSDVRMNMEINLEATHSKFYILTDLQSILLGLYISAYSEWSETNNCSSWVSDMTDYVLDKNVSSVDPKWPVDTPRGLSKSIDKLR